MNRNCKHGITETEELCCRKCVNEYLDKHIMNISKKIEKYLTEERKGQDE